MKRLILSLSLLVLSTAVFAESIEVKVKGMVCSFCAQGLDKKFRAEPAVEDVKVSLERKTINVTTKKDGTLSDEQITKLVLDAGYNVASIERK